MRQACRGEASYGCQPFPLPPLPRIATAQEPATTPYDATDPRHSPEGHGCRGTQAQRSGRADCTAIDVGGEGVQVLADAERMSSRHARCGGVPGPR
jgi:hypothetical protein